MEIVLGSTLGTVRLTQLADQELRLQQRAENVGHMAPDAPTGLRPKCHFRGHARLPPDTNEGAHA